MAQTLHAEASVCADWKCLVRPGVLCFVAGHGGISPISLPGPQTGCKDRETGKLQLTEKTEWMVEGRAFKFQDSLEGNYPSAYKKALEIKVRIIWEPISAIYS